MVHKKYTYKDGKKYGPYLYETKRVNGKVVTKYLGLANEKCRRTKKVKKSKVSKRIKKVDEVKSVKLFRGFDRAKVINNGRLIIPIVFLGVLLLLLLIFLVFPLLPTGNAFFNINGDYSPGETIDGELNFILSEGELVPANSKVLIDFGNVSREFVLSDLVDLETVEGNFFVKGAELTGDGKGYGLIGASESPKEIEFELLVYSANETESGSVGDSAGNSEGSGDSGERNVSDNSSVGSDSGSSGGSDSGSSGGSDSGSGITGSTISETVYTVSGKVSWRGDFKYNLEKWQSAKIVEGSVKIDGKEIADDSIDLNLVDGEAIISTKYFDGMRGFGAEFLGERELILGINLEDLGLVAEKDETLKVSLVYKGVTIVDVENKIKVDESKGVSEEISKEAVVEVEGVKVELIQHGATLGQPVKWVKRVEVSKPTDLNIHVPANAKDVKVGKIQKELVQEASEIERATVVEDVGTVVENFTKGGGKTAVDGGESNGEIVVDDEKNNISESGEENSEIVGGGEGMVAEKTNVTIGTEGSVLTGLVSAELRVGKERGFFGFLKRFFGRLTGRAVTEIEDVPQEVFVEADNPDEVVEVEYYTDAPYAVEEEIPTGKRVNVISPDEVHYYDVLAFTELNESLDVVEPSSVKIHWVEKDIYLTPSLVEDLDADGVYDYIEWIAPELSNQTFDIIVVIAAQHLDENRTFISDIYDEVKELDGNWSEEIPDRHYVRVTFERNLTSEKDITVYPRIVNGTPRIEVYEFNQTEIIAEFTSLNDNEYNKIYLDGSSGVGLGNRTQNTFDLLVLNGSLEFDHIIDPTINVTVSEGTVENVTLVASSFGHLNVSDEGLILYLPFDDNKSTTTVYDYSGSGLDGTKSGNELYNTADGVYGDGFWIGASNDFIQFPADSQEFNVSNRNTTVVFWLNSSAASLKGIISSSIDNTEPNWIISGHPTTAKGKLRVRMTDGGSTGNNVMSTNALNDSVWHHVAVTIEDTGTKYNVTSYIDGSLDKSIIFNVPGDVYGGGTPRIGRWNNYGDYEGNIDEVMIYNRRLSAAEVSDIYNNQSVRFYPRGEQVFVNLNVSNGSSVNVSVAELLNFPGVNFKVILGNKNGAGYSYGSEYAVSGGVASDIPVTTPNNFSLKLVYDSDADRFYTPLLMGNVTINSFEGPPSPSGIGVNVSFVSPTPVDGSTQSATDIEVNLSSTSSSGNHYSFVDFDRDLVFWMRFDDTNSSGDPTDISRYSLNGSLLGTVAISSNGYWGDRGVFPGSARNYITLPVNSQSFNFTDRNTTVSFWFNQSTGDRYGGIVASRLNNNAPNWMIGGLPGAGHGKMKIRLYDGSLSSAQFMSTNELNDSTWHHFVAVIIDEGTQYNITSYVDGSEDKSLIYSVSGDIYDGGSPIIGAWTNYGYYTGDLDDILIFNRSLDAEEISALYNASANQYFHNFTNLSYSTHTFTGHAVDEFGNKNQTEDRGVTISLTSVTDCANLDVAGETYVLQNNISTDGTCFVVKAENITLDGNGYNITGDGGLSDYGIHVDLNSGENFTLRNITISNFGVSVRSHILVGEFSAGQDATNISVFDSTIDSIKSNGIGCAGCDGGDAGFLYLYDLRVLDIIEARGGAGSVGGNGGDAGRIYIEGINVNLTNVSIDLNAGTGTVAGNSGQLVLNYSSNFEDINTDYGKNLSLHLINSSTVWLEKANVAMGGEINWLSVLDSSGLTNLSLNTRISHNHAGINSNVLSALNVSANVTLFGTPGSGLFNPKIKRDGLICSQSTNPACNNFTALDSATVVFNVSSWSNYSIGESLAPVVYDISDISAQSVVEGGELDVTFNVYVYDSDGTSNLNDTFTFAKFSRLGEEERANLSCKMESDLNATNANFTCTIGIWYWDGAGLWNVSAFAQDIDGQNSTYYNETFSLMQSTCMVTGPNNLTWPAIGVTDTNIGSNSNPILLNNTCNKDITVGNIGISAFDLYGVTNPSQAIYAENFSVDVIPDGCGGTQMVNNSNTAIAGAYMIAGNNSVNNGTLGQEELYYCITGVNPDLTSQDYVSAGSVPWTITIS